MDKDLIKRTLSDLAELETNEYSFNLPTDNMDQVKKSLSDLNIKFKEVIKSKKKYLYIYYQDKLLSKYSKANYPNNKFLGQSICNDKFKTEYYLGLNDVPTPESKMFTEKELDKAQQYIQSLAPPFVIKPLDFRQGLGVYTDINSTNFLKAWNKSMELQKKRNKATPKVLIQNQIDGLELRVNITEGIVESAILRLQGYIIGDGQSSVEKLISKKNHEKKRNPYLSRELIVFDEDLNNTLEKIDKSKDSILENDEMIILDKRPELRYGMETYNVTNIIHQNILNIALNAVLAIPGLHTAGVDIIIPNLKSVIGHVIEVNKNPAFNLSLYADKGMHGEPLHYLYKSHILENRIMVDEIQSKDDLNEEDLRIILNRYKFLYYKDEYNRKIISSQHNLKEE